MESSVWDHVLARVETKVNRHSFYTWFRPTGLLADSGNSLTVRVPDLLFKDWLTKHYSGVLAEALEEVRRPGVSVVFVADGVSTRTVSEQPLSHVVETDTATSPGVASGVLDPR